jgi:hypothetical protein
MAEISLKRIERSVAIVNIEGTAPLIVHAWSQKAKQMMLANQQGKKSPKELKDPAADFEAAQYRFTDGGAGFPVMAFKAATVKGGARAFGKAVKMTELRQHLTFLPDGFGTDGMALARLITDAPTRREDMVRVGMGAADIRYRAQYEKWSVDLRIEFLPSVIDLGTIVALVDAGGSNGVGEWRPEKNGSFGTYRVIGEATE